MVKSSSQVFSSYRETLVVATIKSKWALSIFLIPLAIYFVFLSFESTLTAWIVPFFPDEPDKSFGFYNDFLRLCFQEMLWLSFFLLLTWIMLFSLPVFAVSGMVESYLKSRETTFVGTTAIISLVISLAIAYFALESFPNSADEYAYVYQAKTLSDGKLVQQGHPLKDFFHFNHIAQKDGVSVGRFPPGWPLLLSIPYIVGFSANWVNPMLGALALLLFYSFAKRYYGDRVAIWSLISLALTGYYLFNSASFFSHTSCLLFTVAFVYAVYLSEEERRNVYPFVAGLLLGLIVITRYYTALLIFVPWALSLMYRLRWDSIRILFFVGLGTLPALFFMCWYNLKITGDPFLPVTVWADETETIGFVKGHSFSRGIEYTIRRLLLFTYWCSPALLLLYFIFLFQKILDKAQRISRPEDYFFLFLLIGYFFYHHLGGNQYGPRFLLEALPFTVLFVVNRVLRSTSKWPLAFLIAGMAYAILKFPFITMRENRIVRERLDLYRTVERSGISNAVVLIATHTGVIRPMPPRDLTRNDMDYAGNIIYAEDRPGYNRELMNFYSDRTFFRYVRNREKVEGQLVRMP